MARRKLTVAKRVKKYMASNSLARTGRRIAKRANRTAKRTAKKTIRAVNRFDKRLDKKQRRILKKLPKQSRRLKKKGLRALRLAKKRTKTGWRVTKRTFKKLAKPYQLRGRKLKQRRSEQRQEIKGTFDTSRSRIVQASSDPGASWPGEPPKLRTGEGRYSIKAEVRKRGKQIVSRTYVDKKVAAYMAMYEFRQDGEQRPFLKPGLMNNLPDFQSKVGAELKRAAMSVPKKKAVNK